jgi:CDP-paratose 2-epimerase
LRWLDLLGESGAFDAVRAIGLHDDPAARDGEASPWADRIAAAQAVLDRHGSDARIWITEAGFSTWRHDELGQARRFLETLDAPAERLYWRRWRDAAAQAGPEGDPRDAHDGVTRDTGRPKLLARLLTTGGVARSRRRSGSPRLPAPRRPSGRGHRRRGLRGLQPRGRLSLRGP